MTTTRTRPPTGAAPRGRRRTPDAHSFPTRRYDLVKEFVLALVGVIVLTIALAIAFGSPDERAISLQDWARSAPNDIVATAAAELSGDSTTAGYGPPYNTASDGQTLLGLPLQKLAGVTYPIDAAQDFVITPLQSVTGDPALSLALRRWRTAGDEQRAAWASAYATALGAAPNGDPAQVAAGSYGPVPTLATAYAKVAAAGGLEQMVSNGSFYGNDPTRRLLLLADGTYLEDQARARSLGGDQWGMMNETGNYPGQPWLWLYTFWYQVPPFSTSDNADALVWGLMMVLSLLLVLLPFIPGLRDIPRLVPLHRVIWRDWYGRGRRGGGAPRP
ncbi:hypothetical protein [Intrasporangium sp. YIM S08009]|uniref:hypothetical protein n=1 Tax=Intrasporangium zincisolvens TaxID=3080018 RepID=UPI002B05A3FD|nr:hypothetical protein [Intrasporangium sp. YIM S08009]